MISVQCVEAKTLENIRSDYGFGGRNRQSIFYKEAEKVGKITKQPKGERSMIKRLVVICCILLVPAIAAAQGTTNYGDFWVGGQLGAVFTPEQDVTVTVPGFFRATGSMETDPGFSAGAIVGYNFCMSYRQPWERYFGVALDFQWNQFNHPGIDEFGKINGNQFALSFLGRLQYPLMGSERFTRGRLVPFLMFGPSVVWSTADFSNYGGNTQTSTNFGLVAEVGLEFFVCPTVSIGPSFRYRHVFGPNFSDRFVDADMALNQFMILGRLAYHF
jgi:opacity protein-like surface antigen